MSEPVRVTWEMGLGLARAHPPAGIEPRLLIAAGCDRLVPIGYQILLARRLNAELKVFPQLPHELWQEDDQGEVMAAVLDFLEINADG